MPLLEQDIRKIIGAIDWVEEDVKTLRNLLIYAGKDKNGNYEHYHLTTAINNYESGIRQLKGVVKDFETRTGKTVEAHKSSAPATTPPVSSTASTLKKKEDGFLTDTKKLEPLVTEMVNKYPEEAEHAKNGRHGKLGFLTGKVCVAAGGDGDPKLVQKMIGEYLEDSVA